VPAPVVAVNQEVCLTALLRGQIVVAASADLNKKLALRGPHKMISPQRLKGAKFHEAFL
jgi:hypothetical protein